MKNLFICQEQKESFVAALHLWLRFYVAVVLKRVRGAGLTSLCLSQGYQFEEENPYLSHPDPLSEGVKRMEAGDIPGAVRFFESAVQKEPDNQLVRFFPTPRFNWILLFFCW